MLRGVLVSVALACSSAAIAQNNLLCPAPATTSCDTFHYHVSMFRPDTRTLVDLSSINDFGSQAACDRARDAAIQRNLAIVDYFRRVKGDDRYEPDRIGPCHCDMTPESAHAAQLRTMAEINLRVRERLMSSGLPSDNDLVRSTLPSPSPASPLGGPRFVPLPPPVPVMAASNDPDDLRATRATATSAQSSTAFDLPLIDLSGGAVPPAALEASITPPAQQQQPSPSDAGGITINTQPDGSKVITNQPVTERVVAAPSAPEPSPQPDPDAEAAIDAFIAYESQRVRNVVTASAAITDADLKERIFEACTQRTQLLSNLRSLIEGAGANSRLATSARSATSEAQRIAFIARLFGSDMPPHWAPKDASDVLLTPTSGDPEKVLRDTSGRFGGAAKRRALYEFLSHNQVTENQQMWLYSVIDALLQ